MAEYLGEGTIEPIRMVRSGKMKCITVNGYPPQLYDLERDPEESTNLHGNSSYATASARILNAPRRNGMARRSRRM